MSRFGFLLVGLVGVVGCAPRLPTDTSAGGEDGAGGDTGTWTDGGTDGGESNDGTSAPFLGVRGVVIFDPVPESWGEAVLDLRLYAYDPWVADESADSVAWYRELVSESPAPFELTLHPTKYNPEWGHYVAGYGDMDRDEERSCGDYSIYSDSVDPTSGEPVTLVATPAESWCDEPPPPNPCLGLPEPQPGMSLYEEGEAVYVDDTLYVDIWWFEEEMAWYGYRFELLPEQQMPGTYVLTVEEYCDEWQPGACWESSSMHEVVVEVVSLDEICLAGRFVEPTEGYCTEDIECGGFVVPIR